MSSLSERLDTVDKRGDHLGPTAYRGPTCARDTQGSIKFCSMRLVLQVESVTSAVVATITRLLACRDVIERGICVNDVI